MQHHKALWFDSTFHPLKDQTPLGGAEELNENTKDHVVSLFKRVRQNIHLTKIDLNTALGGKRFCLGNGRGGIFESCDRKTFLGEED